jgi:hypothetical protein
VEFGCVELLEGIAGAVAVFGVDGVVPLVEPGEEFLEGGEQRGEALGLPAPGVLGLLVEAGEGCGLLGVIPAGPGDDGGRCRGRLPCPGGRPGAPSARRPCRKSNQ